MNPNTLQRLRRLPYVGLAAAAFAIPLIAASPKTSDKGRKPSTGVLVDERPLERDGKLTFSFAPVVKRVTPSVVKVNTVVKARQTSMPSFPGMEDPMFRRFFGDQPGGRRTFRTPQQQGAGSGVIVTEDGYILTNNHVVDGADEVKVGLQDGREFTAKVVGKDPKTDVAVVKVDAKDLPFLQVADSDKIEVGDVVLAIGNPFNLGQTVTMGLVSATGRATLGLDYEDFIQTDAAINPGNSGGALVDAEGRLIGINTAILSRSGGNQGIGFAVPVNLARDVMDSLVADGKVTRGYLGVLIQDLTPALVRKLELKQPKGALVGDVVPQGPADKAGLKSGDIVTEFDGKAVKDSRHFRLQVARTKPGESVPVKLLRDGATKALSVTVKEQPGSEQLARNDSKNADDNENLKGVAVGDLDSSARTQFKVPDSVRGVVVLQVDPDSQAAEAGLKPGDVILEINKHPVKSAEEAVRLTENPKDKTTLLRVWSEGSSRFLVVDESNAG
jgi:serine protease Do